MSEGRARGGDAERAPRGTHIVVVTYNRDDYLAQLLDSIRKMSPSPAGVVVVDNASTDRTPEVVADFVRAMPSGITVNHRLEENIGGSGGFSAGVQIALARGAEWVWLMDDDVSVLPHALADLGRWTDRFQVLHGRRWDHDGTPFFWQTRFSEVLGIFYPIPGDIFKRRDFFLTNAGTFEGMLVHRDVVAQVGLPDPRFFLTWDDAVYGWLSSRVTEVAYVNDFVLQRMRPQRRINLGIRHLNDSSDLSRFLVMRNRAYVANYLEAHGRLRRSGFALGTLLTFAKEVVRAVAVERRPRGVVSIAKGYGASRRARRDDTWEPMPPLPDVQSSTAGGARPQ
jgi:rhamnopyranosyl-N-acetylglucosaminyl-diphospho-decaprenol beta-1,3/1,4-galactofuranosyltransferase